jgi:hypothetical protein
MSIKPKQTLTKTPSLKFVKPESQTPSPVVSKDQQSLATELVLMKRELQGLK